jgi:hypothetical protein
MRPETVERNPKAGDMEDIADEKTLAVERNDSRTPTQDGSKRIVTHADAEAVNGLVGDKGPTVGDHVVSSTSVGNHETRWCATACGRDGLEQRLNQRRREYNIVRRLSDRAGRTAFEGNPTTRGSGSRRWVRRNGGFRLNGLFELHPILVPKPAETVRGIFVLIRNQRRRHTRGSGSRRIVSGRCLEPDSGRFGTRGAGRNSWRGSASGRLGTTRGATPHFNQLEAQFRKHGAFGGEMFVLGVANGAVEIPLHGAAPTR